MMRIFYILALILITSVSHAQSFDNEESLSLSQGAYFEVHDEDSIIQIGSALYNVTSNEIISITFVENTIGVGLEDELVSRWLAVDALNAKYVSLSPYNFVGNSPLRYIDPDGNKIKPLNGRATAAVQVMYNKYKFFMTIEIKDGVYSSKRFDLSTGKMKDHIKNHNERTVKYNARATKYNAEHKDDEGFKEKPLMGLIDEDDAAEASTFLGLLTKQEITEVLVLETSDGTGDNVRGDFGDSQEGSSVNGSGVITENNEYNKMVAAIKKTREMNKPIAEAVYDGKTSEIKYLGHGGTQEKENIKITADQTNGNSAYFENKRDKDKNDRNYTVGILVIDGTNHSDSQNADVLIKDAPKK